ncbi:hypothetical protein, partial [Blautia obeum]|uniref:hypothetical protein n=1 Tax=Blautia obeum TaxID=40520 RepID=UPI003218FF19
NKKKRSFKRKMVLGITPNTKFVYSLAVSNLETVSFFELKSGNIFLCEVDHKLFRHGIGQTSAEKLTFDHIDGSNCIDADDIFCCCVAR